MNPFSSEVEHLLIFRYQYAQLSMLGEKESK